MEPDRALDALRGEGFVLYDYSILNNRDEMGTGANNARETRANLGMYVSGLDAVTRPAAFFAAYDESIETRIAPFVTTGHLLYIREPKISQITLLPVLEYLSKSSTISQGMDLCKQPTFIKHFREFLETSNSRLTVADVRSEFRKAVVLHVNAETKQFSDSESEQRRRARAARIRPLREVIFHRDRTAIPRLLASLGARQWFDPLLGVLIATSSLIDEAARKGAGSEFGDRDVQDVLLAIWCGIVLAAMDSKASDRDVEFVDRLLRDYLCQSDPIETVTPLENHHASIKATLGADADALGYYEEQFREKATAFIEIRKSICGWLFAGLTNRPELEEKESAVAIVADRDRGKRPFRPKLSDIVGHQHAVAALQRRFRSGNHDRPVMIIGARGLGRKTLARAYAGALQCTAERGDLSEPCHRCVQCQQFRDNTTFDYLELQADNLNAMSPQDRDIALQSSIDRLKFALSIAQRVYVFDGLDAIESSSNRFLKTIDQFLQSNASGTTFVFVVETTEGIEALASRCQQLCVTAPSTTDLRTLADRQLERSGVNLDVKLRELALAACDLNPSALARNMELVSAPWVSSFEDAVKALGCEAVRDAAAFVVSAVTNQEPLMIGERHSSIDVSVLRTILVDVWNVAQGGPAHDSLVRILVGREVETIAKKLITNEPQFEKWWESCAIILLGLKLLTARDADRLRQLSALVA